MEENKSETTIPCEQIQVKKTEKLSDMTQCSICYTQYDAQDHIPLGLHCQHNICSFSLDMLFVNGEIKCPLCKKISSYEAKSQVPRNFTMLEIINLQKCPQVQIQISLNDQAKMMSPINDLIENIKAENVKIDKIFEDIREKVKRIKDFNLELIGELEIFMIKSTIQRNKIFKEHFDSLNNFLSLSNPMNECSEQLKILQLNIDQISKKTSYISSGQMIVEVESCISTEEELEQKNQQINYEELTKENSIFNSDVLIDYKKLNQNIKDNILKHTSSTAFRKRNFIIKKEDNFPLILELLQHESSQNKCNALNTLGFLYYHGIGVKANKQLAFEKFKRSAKLNDSDANTLCYFLEQAVEKKYDYLENGIMNGSARIMSTLGYMLKRGKLDNILIKNKIISLLYKVGAEQGISVSMKNYAAILISGCGVKKNLDQGYDYYFRSIKAGCYEAKMWLDNLFPGAESFKQKHPDYKVLESGNYEEYAQNQEIILL